MVAQTPLFELSENCIWNSSLVTKYTHHLQKIRAFLPEKTQPSRDTSFAPTSCPSATPLRSIYLAYEVSRRPLQGFHVLRCQLFIRCQLFVRCQGLPRGKVFIKYSTCIVTRVCPLGTGLRDSASSE